MADLPASPNETVASSPVKAIMSSAVANAPLSPRMQAALHPAPASTTSSPKQSSRALHSTTAPAVHPASSPTNYHLPTTSPVPISNQSPSGLATNVPPVSAAHPMPPTAHHHHEAPAHPQNNGSKPHNTHEYAIRHVNTNAMTSSMNDGAEETYQQGLNQQMQGASLNDKSSGSQQQQVGSSILGSMKSPTNQIDGAAKTVTYAASKDALLQSSAAASSANGTTAAADDIEWITLQAQPSDPKYEDEKVFVQVTKSDAAYNLKPVHCGRNVVFLNAQDPAFYKRSLPTPSLVVWLLSNLQVQQSHALKRMFESGWRQNIQVRVMDTNNFELIASKDGLEGVLYQGERVELPDAIFNRVGANIAYFGMAVIRQLEQMGVLMFNTLRSLEISKDKMLTLQHLAAHGLPIPKTLLAKFPLNLDAIKREFEYPIIMKKASGSQGKGIIKVESHSQLEDLVEMLDTGKPIIFQEFIQASSGKDLRVFVVGGRVVGSMMRIAGKGQFKANVHMGGSVKPVKISPQVEWLVLETVKIVGLDIAGVDLLIDKNTYKICEVNSSPGFEGLEKALGENIAIKQFMYMKMRLGVWRRGGKSGKSAMSITVPVEQEVANTTNVEDAETRQLADEEAAGSNARATGTRAGQASSNTNGALRQQSTTRGKMSSRRMSSADTG